MNSKIYFNSNSELFPAGNNTETASSENLYSCQLNPRTTLKRFRLSFSNHKKARAPRRFVKSARRHEDTICRMRTMGLLWTRKCSASCVSLTSPRVREGRRTRLRCQAFPFYWPGSGTTMSLIMATYGIQFVEIATASRRRENRPGSFFFLSPIFIPIKTIGRFLSKIDTSCSKIRAKIKFHVYMYVIGNRAVFDWVW